MKTVAPILLDLKQAAALLSMSRTAFYAARLRNEIPTPVSLGGLKWDRRKLELWVRKGCPKDIEMFESWYQNLSAKAMV